ncbi:VacJ family lipoprotein [Ferrimonas pelagia]|uniref:VacJ family lipoprotein n=1 Tax=Ferrimonas pelagia TaxID=1177826 RepID=A0ABP9EEH9_9GAMM
MLLSWAVSFTAWAEMDEFGIEESYKDPRDPIEPFNRWVWDLNYLYLDRYIVRPVVHVYADYVPRPAQNGVENFVRNLDEPFSAVNNLLQLKPAWAANATARFLINSTIGVVGLMDVATEMGLERKQDQFGEVLGYWGVPDGPYLMLPVLGPSSVRDEAGDVVDKLYFPHSLFNFWQAAGRWTLDGLATRSKLIEQEALLDSSLDPYAFTREAYFQYIEFQLYDGNPPLKEEDDDWLDDYLDEID